MVAKTCLEKAPSSSLEDDVLLAAAADDGGELVAGLGQGLGQGEQHGRARAAAHADHPAQLLDLGGLAQGTGHVATGSRRPGTATISFVLMPTAWMISVMVPACGIVVGDGERDALAPLADSGR